VTTPATGGNTPLQEHVQLIRAAADLIEQAGIAGLAVWPDPDEIVIQVPEHAGDTPARTAQVARLAALTGGEPAPAPSLAGPRAGSTPAASSPGTRCTSSPRSARRHHDPPSPSPTAAPWPARCAN
jgi:hypothetical protein